jgi:hypothetical protein
MIASPVNLAKDLTGIHNKKVNQEGFDEGESFNQHDNF